MLTRQIDAALDAMDACRKRTPALLAYYRPGTPVRTALECLLAALAQVDVALVSPDTHTPAQPRAVEDLIRRRAP